MSFFRYLQGTEPRENGKTVSNGYDEHIRRKEQRLRVGDVKPGVNVATPKSFAEIEGLIKNLRKSHGIVVDLRAAPAGEGQRYLDFLSGAAYALEGSVERLQNKTFLMTPKGVTIAIDGKETKEIVCKRKKSPRNS